jgi:hypothetical protein
MSNYTSIRAGDIYQHKSSMVDQCIIDEYAAHHQSGHTDHSPMTVGDSPLLAWSPRSSALT